MVATDLVIRHTFVFTWVLILIETLVEHVSQWSKVLVFHIWKLVTMMTLTDVCRIIITGFWRFDLIRFFRWTLHRCCIAILDLIDFCNQTFHAFDLGLTCNILLHTFGFQCRFWLLLRCRINWGDCIKLVIDILYLIYTTPFNFNLRCHIFNHWWIFRHFFLILNLICLWWFQWCSKVWHWLWWCLRILGRLWWLLLLILLCWHLVEKVLVNFRCHLLLLQVCSIVGLFAAHVLSLVERSRRYCIYAGLCENIGRCGGEILIAVFLELCGESINVPDSLLLRLFLQISMRPLSQLLEFIQILIHLFYVV